MPRRRRLNLNSKIKKTLNTMLKKKMEVKREVLVHNLSIDNTGTIVPLMDTVASGTAHDQRIGNKVNMLSSTLRYLWALSDAGYQNCRFAIVKTRTIFPTGGAPAPAPPLLWENQSYSTFGGVYASWDYDIVSKVYYDKNITLNQQYAGLRVSRFQKAFVKMAQEVVYDNALAGSSLNNLYIVLSSDSQILPHPSCQMVIRNRYIDA